jgi:NADPH-dependent glutamate synthase beta subunit-like oxidoreductase
MMGYHASVFESAPVLGGMMRFGIPAFRLSREILDRELYDIVELGVRVWRNITIGRDLTLHDLFDRGYRSIFLAVGAQKGRSMGIPGEDLEGVSQAVDFLWDLNLGQSGHEASQVRLGRKVVVVGGGLVGCETALHLALQGQKVSIIEMMDDILLKVNVISRYGMIESLTEKGVSWSCGMKLVSVKDSEIIVSDKKGKKEHSINGHAVYAMGFEPGNNGLSETLTGKVPELYSIGDCVSPRKIWNAIHEGFRIANDI